jgi:hypothetical protein
MADKWAMPTPQQNAAASLAQGDLVELINRLIREGNDPRVVIAALGSATADTITCVFGPTAVAPWFEKQAQVVRDLQRPWGN